VKGSGREEGVERGQGVPLFQFNHFTIRDIFVFAE